MAGQLLVAQDPADAPGGRSERFGPFAGQGGLGASGDDVEAAFRAPGGEQPGEGDQGVGARAGVVAQGGPVAVGEGGRVEVPQVQDGSVEGPGVPVEVREQAAQVGVGRGVDGVRAAVAGGGVGRSRTDQAAAFAAGAGQGGEGVGRASGVGEEQPVVGGCGGGRGPGARPFRVARARVPYGGGVLRGEWRGGVLRGE